LAFRQLCEFSHNCRYANFFLMRTFAAVTCIYGELISKSSHNVL
jgi:hypothetical protein